MASNHVRGCPSCLSQEKKCVLRPQRTISLVWQKWQHLTSQVVGASGTARVGSGVVCQRSSSGGRWPCPAEPRVACLPWLHSWGHGGWGSPVTVTWPAKHVSHLILGQSRRKRTRELNTQVTEPHTQVTEPHR